MEPPSRSTSMRLRSRDAAVAALLAVLGLGSGACAGMDEGRLESALLELEGKELARQAGLRRVPGKLTVAGRERGVELVHQRFAIPGPGAEPGPPLVLVHGTPGSLLDWTALLAELERAGLDRPREVLTLDLVGHGVTRERAGPYSFELGGRWIEAFLEALDLWDVTLVGQSYGGEMVWRAALDRPERVGRVVLIASAGYERPPGGFLPEEQAMRTNPLARLGHLLNSPARVRTALAPHYVDGVPQARVREVYLLCENAENWRAMVDLARDENGTRQGELPRLSQPTLLIWGERDLAYPVEGVARRFEADIPRARLVVIPGSGHYVHEERPREVARALVDFLTEEQPPSRDPR